MGVVIARREGRVGDIMQTKGLVLSIMILTIVGCKCASPRVTIRSHRTDICKRAQTDLTRCSSQRSNDMLKTCARQLERVHRECPQK